MLITHLDPAPRWTEGIGYKIFLGPHRPIDGFKDADSYDGVTYRTGETHISTDESMHRANGTLYPTGYHVYRFLKSALKATEGNPRVRVVRVHFSDVLATGSTKGRSIVVAKKIILEEQVNRQTAKKVLRQSGNW